MELFLNLFWLAISAGGFAAWSRVSRRHGQRGRRLELAALAAACLLLFPLISVTDDLQSQAVLAEGSRPQVSAKLFDADGNWKQARHAGAPTYLIVAQAAAAVTFQPLYNIPVPGSPLVCRTLARWTPLRAPPGRVASRHTATRLT